MERSTYDAWCEEERQEEQRVAATRPDDMCYFVDRQRTLDRERNELLARFPHSVVAVGIYAEHDYAGRWCWTQIGPENGPWTARESEYPACPLVLQSKRLERGTARDQSGKVFEWKRKRCDDPGEHRHEGDWCFRWFGKTDYDYGYGGFFFRHENDCSNFLAAFQALTWTEDWD